MEQKLVKHVLRCMECDFNRIEQDYSVTAERALLTIGREHSKETEHSLMLQS